VTPAVRPLQVRGVGVPLRNRRCAPVLRRVRTGSTSAAVSRDQRLLPTVRPVGRSG